MLRSLTYLVSWDVSHWEEGSPTQTVGEASRETGSNMKLRVSKFSLQDIPVCTSVLLSSLTFFPWWRTPTCTPPPSIAITVSMIVLYKNLQEYVMQRLEPDKKANAWVKLWQQKIRSEAIYLAISIYTFSEPTVAVSGTSI